MNQSKLEVVKQEMLRVSPAAPAPRISGARPPAAPRGPGIRGRRTRGGAPGRGRWSRRPRGISKPGAPGEAQRGQRGTGWEEARGEGTAGAGAGPVRGREMEAGPRGAQKLPPPREGAQPRAGAGGLRRPKREAGARRPVLSWLVCFRKCFYSAKWFMS